MQVNRTAGFSRDILRELASLKSLNNYRGPLALVEDLFVFSVAAWLILWPGGCDCIPWYFSIAMKFIGWFLAGARMRALATLVHDSAHRTLAKNKALNWLLGTIGSGWWILQVRWAYRQSHVFQHHPNLGDEIKDPDTAQYVRSKLLEEEPDHFVGRNLLSAAFGLKGLAMLPYLLRDRLAPGPGVFSTIGGTLEYLGFLAFLAALSTGLLMLGWLDEFLLVWAPAYLLVFPSIGWLIETSEHFPLIWVAEDDLHTTRNRKGGPVERFFFGIHGESWHLVHHLFPAIPFWDLAKAHKVLMRDPAYAASERAYGGLFTRGPNGAPSILECLPHELRVARHRLLMA